eukprot:gene8801-33670_t
MWTSGFEGACSKVMWTSGLKVHAARSLASAWLEGAGSKDMWTTSSAEPPGAGYMGPRQSLPALSKVKSQHREINSAPGYVQGHGPNRGLYSSPLPMVQGSTGVGAGKGQAPEEALRFWSGAQPKPQESEFQYDVARRGYMTALLSKHTKIEQQKMYDAEQEALRLAQAGQEALDRQLYFEKVQQYQLSNQGAPRRSYQNVAKQFSEARQSNLKEGQQQLQQAVQGSVLGAGQYQAIQASILSASIPPPSPTPGSVPAVGGHSQGTSLGGWASPSTQEVVAAPTPSSQCSTQATQGDPLHQSTTAAAPSTSPPPPDHPQPHRTTNMQGLSTFPPAQAPAPASQEAHHSQQDSNDQPPSSFPTSAPLNPAQVQRPPLSSSDEPVGHSSGFPTSAPLNPAQVQRPPLSSSDEPVGHSSGFPTSAPLNPAQVQRPPLSSSDELVGHSSGFPTSAPLYPAQVQRPPLSNCAEPVRYSSGFPTSAPLYPVQVQGPPQSPPISSSEEPVRYSISRGRLPSRTGLATPPQGVQMVGRGIDTSPIPSRPGSTSLEEMALMRGGGRPRQVEGNGRSAVGAGTGAGGAGGRGRQSSLSEKGWGIAQLSPALASVLPQAGKGTTVYFTEFHETGWVYRAVQAGTTVDLTKLNETRRVYRAL